MDIDAVIMALYVIVYAEGRIFATPEPRGPCGNSYPAMFGKPDKEILDALVADSVKYWKERESALKEI